MCNDVIYGLPMCPSRMGGTIATTHIPLLSHYLRLLRGRQILIWWTREQRFAARTIASLPEDQGGASCYSPRTPPINRGTAQVDHPQLEMSVRKRQAPAVGDIGDILS